MKRLLKVLLGIIVFVVLLIPVAITFTIGWRPFVGPRTRELTDRRFEATPARLERGGYLVNGVLGCLYCHTERDRTLPGGPPKAGHEGSGAAFVEPDLPGKLYASNITPDVETGIGNWTDDMIARAVREGIGGDGRALFPVMPYQNYRLLSDEDLASVVVYLRSLPPVRNALPATEIVFPVSRLIMSVPQPITEAVAEPTFADPIARGEYMSTLASCADCHTPSDDQGARLPGMEFAGGFVLNGFSGKPIAALNLTSDASGIPYYDEMTFLNTLRIGRIGARLIDPAMPWSLYRNMTDDDLKDLYAFIKQLKPVVHHVDNVTEPTMCPRCGHLHGLGDMN
jgi:hypothetical protein